MNNAFFKKMEKLKSLRVDKSNSHQSSMFLHFTFKDTVKEQIYEYVNTFEKKKIDKDKIVFFLETLMLYPLYQTCVEKHP